MIELYTIIAIENSARIEHCKKGGIKTMRQEIELAVVVQNGVIQKIGVSQVMQPQIRFNGKGIRWFPDQMKGRKKCH